MAAFVLNILKTRVIPVFFVLMIVWIPLTHQIQGSSDEINYLSLEEKLENIRSAYNVPTVHATITRDKELVWTKGFGNQTAENTVFSIASLQKPFVGTAVLQLYEQGLIDLDSNIDYYLPFNVKHHAYPDEVITIRMLLIHTSGLASELRYEFYWDTQGYLTHLYSMGYDPEILEMSLGEYLNESFTPEGYNYYPEMWLYRPNERYSYSNTGFKLLQYLIECVTGLSFEDYLKENIFSPLNMTNSGINASNFIDNHAIPYIRRFNINHELPLYSSHMIRSSVTDLSHFLIAHLNNGKYDENQLLSSSSTKMMHANLVRYSDYMNPIIQDVNNYHFYQHSYGLGWSHFHDGFEGHGGNTPGFASVMAGKKTSFGGSIGFILFMNANAINQLDDQSEVQSCYTELINTILFELNLIPTINQEAIDLVISILTTMLGIVLLFHYGMRIIYKQKDPSKAEYSGGKISYTFYFLIFSLFGILNIVNFFYLYDWVKLLLYLPIVSYLGIVFIHYIKDKGSIPPYFSNAKITNVLQAWLVLSVLGLALYNSTTIRMSPVMPIITTLLCLGSMLLILIDTFLTKEYNGRLNALY